MGTHPMIAIFHFFFQCLKLCWITVSHFEIWCSNQLIWGNQISKVAVFNSCRRVSLVLRFFDNFLLKLHYTKTKPCWNSIQTMAPLVAMTSRQRGIHPRAQLSSQWYAAIVMSVSIYNSSAADRLSRTGCSRPLASYTLREAGGWRLVTLTNPHT